MANLDDYGIRFISHGCWSDPEIEFKKSAYQKLVFNYWDVVECTDYEKLCSSENDADLQLLAAQLSDLTPSEYRFPIFHYDWLVVVGGVNIDSLDYYEEYNLSPKEDFILHNAGQALRQAISYLYDSNQKTAEIRIFRSEAGLLNLVALYDFQGSTLKDRLH